MNTLRTLAARLVPSSMTNRVFALYGATLAVLLSVGLFLFLGHQYRHQVEDTQRSSVTMIEVMALAVQDSVVIGDYDTLRKTLERSVRGSIFSSGIFIDMAGGRIEVDSTDPVQSGAPAWFVRWVEQRFQDENRPMNVGGRDYGVLRLRFDAHTVAAELWELTVNAIVVGLISLLPGLLLMRALLKRWLGSLDQLQAFGQGIASGELDLKQLDKVDAPAEFERVFELFERTAILMREREQSRRALDNQKFALDQHAIVSITDLHGVITYANDRFCEITGFSRDQLLGQNHRIIKSGTHTPAFYADLWDTIASGRVWRGEICNRARSGELYWVDATIVPLLDEQGRPEQYIAIRTDITDRKAIETSLQAAKEAADQANQAKSGFVANMSHEIRTPLNAVMGMLQLLQASGLSARQADFATKSERAAKALLQLLNDILDFSKIEADKLSLEIRPFNIDHLMRDLSAILSSSVGARSIEVLFDIDPSLPRYLMGDELRLKQVLINLGGNAVKFTERGEVVVRLKVRERTASDLLLEFSVIDSGVGIPADQLTRIFDGFSQAEASTTRRFGGTGLGLTICQRLVRLMGGQITVDSELGKGSTFRFAVRMPLAEVAGEEATTPSPGLPDLRGLHVLVVDDNAAARTVLSEMAASLGWQADVAANGPQAIAMSIRKAQAGQPYDAAFVDWQMEGMDGWQTSLQLKQQEGAAATTTVVMVTAHSSEMLASRSAAEQAALGGFLIKPVTASMLVDALADAGRGGAAGRREPASPIPAGRPLAGLRLLVVEDNANNREVAQELLQMVGAEVSLAHDGEKGVAAIFAAQPPFDAVLMDVQMPVLDGYGATARVRARPGFESLPIIAMTANAMTSDREECLANGMNDHIGKPINLAGLVPTILRHVQPPAAAEPAAAQAPAAPPAVEAAADNALPAEAVEAARRYGLDLEGSIERLGAGRAFYLRMARSCIAGIEPIVADIEIALREGDGERLSSEAHKLKGPCGILGASGFVELASAIEAVVHRHGELQEAVPLVARLRTLTDGLNADAALLFAALSLPVAASGEGVAAS